MRLAWTSAWRLSGDIYTCGRFQLSRAAASLFWINRSAESSVCCLVCLSGGDKVRGRGTGWWTFLEAPKLESARAHLHLLLGQQLQGCSQLSQFQSDLMLTQLSSLITFSPPSGNLVYGSSITVVPHQPIVDAIVWPLHFTPLRNGEQPACGTWGPEPDLESVSSL